MLEAILAHLHKQHQTFLLALFVVYLPGCWLAPAAQEISKKYERG